MGIPVARDLQAELNAKVKALFDKVAEAINKEHPSHQDFDFESFVEGFDEDSPLTQEVFEYLVKDSALRYWDANPLTGPSPPYPHRHTIHHASPTLLSSSSHARVTATSSGSAVVPENSGGDNDASSQSARARWGLQEIGSRNGNTDTDERLSANVNATRASEWTERTQRGLTAPTRHGRTPWLESDENEDDDSEMEEPMRSSSVRTGFAFNERLNSSIFNESDDDLEQDTTTAVSPSSNTSFREAIPLPPHTSVFGVDSQTRPLSTPLSLLPPIDGWFDGSSRASRTSSYSFSQIETFRRATESLQRDIRSLRSQVAATQASFAAQRSSARHNTDERRMALEQHLQRLQLLERHHTRSAVNLMEAQVQNVRRQQEQQRQQQQEFQQSFRQRIIQRRQQQEQQEVQQAFRQRRIQEQQLEDQTPAQSTVDAPSTSSPLSLSETVSIFTSRIRNARSLPAWSNVLPYLSRVTPNALPSPPSTHASSAEPFFTSGRDIQPQSSETSSPTIISNRNAQDESLTTTGRSRPPLTPTFSSTSSLSSSSSFSSSSSPFMSRSLSRSLSSRADSWRSRDSEQSSGAESASDTTRRDLQASFELPSITDTLTTTAVATEASIRATLDDSLGTIGSSLLRRAEASRANPENYTRPSAEDYSMFTALSQRRRRRLRAAMEAAEGRRDHGDGEPTVELLLSDDSLLDPVGERQSTLLPSAPLTPRSSTSGREGVDLGLERAVWAEAVSMLTPASTSRSTASPEPAD